MPGLLWAERKFRRLKGHRATPTLLEALEPEARGNRLEPDTTWCKNGRRNRLLFNYESHILGLVGQGGSRGRLAHASRILWRIAALGYAQSC